MGSFFSKKVDTKVDTNIREIESNLKKIENNFEPKIRNLEVQLSFLSEKQMDLNSDGKVTRSEMETYLNSIFDEKLETLQTHQKKLESEMLQKLENENEKLREENIYLRNSIQKFQTNQISNEKQMSNVSEYQIESFVDDLLADPNTNIYGIPDFIEKKMYTKMLTLFLGSLEHTFENTGVYVCGHRVRLSIQPKD